MDPLRTADGLSLARSAWWPPAGQACRGTLLLVHGLGEHAGRHERAAQAFARAGWRVEAYDQRGHGRSGGDRGALAWPHALLADLALAVDAVRPADGGPLVLLGHSLGGLVAARFVAEGLQPQPAAWHRPVQALLLSSPALDAGLSWWQQFQLRWVAPILPMQPMPNGLDRRGLSRDPAVIAAYAADPLVHDRITPRLAHFIVRAGEQVRDAAPRWPVPTLLQWAGADRLVAPRGSEAFVRAAPASMVTGRPWPGLFHELMNEPEHEQVLAEYGQWLAERFPPRAASPAP